MHKAVVFNLGNIVPGEKCGKGNNIFFYHHSLGRQIATGISYVEDEENTHLYVHCLAQNLNTAKQLKAVFEYPTQWVSDWFLEALIPSKENKPSFHHDHHHHHCAISMASASGVRGSLEFANAWCQFYFHIQCSILH